MAERKRDRVRRVKAHPDGGNGTFPLAIEKEHKHSVPLILPQTNDPMRNRFPLIECFLTCGAIILGNSITSLTASAEITATVEKITSGPKHHFFGYIGHGLTIPWNASGRYIVSLRTDFIDRMPAVGDTADVVLIDTTQGNQVTVVDQTRAWNLQQGTMFYWNPNAAETQFFFNDVDPKTGQVFTVLYDIAAKKRVREYRFGAESIANGGVAPNGKWFAGINYGKISRSREVIAYPGTSDAMENGPANPENDGVFRVDIATGERTLLVTYKHLQKTLIDNPDDRAKLGAPEKYPLYAHHTLWNRDGEWLSFIVRGKGNKRPSAGCAVRWDGSDFRKIPFAGHPEWLEGTQFVLASKEDGAYNLYDVAKAEWAGTLGGPDIFPDTDDDNALSPDGKWYVGSHRPTPAELVYTFFRRSDGAWGRSQPVPAKSGGGNVRIDSAPRWNRASDTILAPGLDPDGTLQLYLVRLKADGKP